MNRLIPLAVLICALSACSIGPRGPVTFNVAVNPAWFSPQAPLTVRIFNQQQLEAGSQSLGCIVSNNAGSETPEVICPPGVTAQAVNPELFVFQLDQLGPRLEVRSTTVRAGERFRLVVSGLASDGCNNTTGSLEWVAESETATVELDDLTWRTTEMACLPLP